MTVIACSNAFGHETSAWSQLPENILCNIFKRIPRWICVCRLVNKHWHRCSFDGVDRLSLHHLSAQVADFSNITTLTLGSAEATMQFQDLQYLSKLTKLTSLYFYDCTYERGFGLEYLNTLSRLKLLKFTQCFRPNSSEFLPLRSLSWLTQLEFYKCSSITDRDLSSLSNLDKLRNLILFRCSNIALNALETPLASSLENLTALSLAYCQKVNDQSADHLGTWNSLRALNINGTMISGVGLGKLSVLTQLQHLSAGHCCLIKDEGASQLKTLSSLKQLDLTACNLTDQSLEFLTHLHQLQALNISGNLFTNSGVNKLSRLKRLNSLHITQLFTLSCIAFTALTSLTSLKLNSNENAVLLRANALRKLPFLQSLDANDVQPEEIIFRQSGVDQGRLKSTRSISE